MQNANWGHSFIWHLRVGRLPKHFYNAVHVDCSVEYDSPLELGAVSSNSLGTKLNGWLIPAANNLTCSSKNLLLRCPVGQIVRVNAISYCAQLGHYRFQIGFEF